MCLVGVCVGVSVCEEEGMECLRGRGGGRGGRRGGRAASERRQRAPLEPTHGDIRLNKELAKTATYNVPLIITPYF